MELPPKHVRFTHTPLDFKNKEIRLITIRPSSDPLSPIQITMKNVDFSERINAFSRYRVEVNRLGSQAPQWASRERDGAIYDKFMQGTFNFIALSYAWGPELPVQDILVTSSECRGWLSVRQNLYDFLKIKRDWLSVRQNVDEFLEIAQNLDPASFWIDQICINQGKNDEKAHQVNQMADIYSAASVVEAWLGSGFDGSDKLMDLIIRESSFKHPYIPEGSLAHHSLSELLGVSEPETRELFPLLHQFACLAYWSRLWVTQEIVLGRVVHIRIGLKTVSWDTFYEGWERLTEIMQLWETWNWKALKGLCETEEDEYMASYGGVVWKRIRDIAQGRDGTNKSWDTVQDLIRGTECSNVRDRVYGMMGMLNPSLRVFPDYSMHPQDILLELLNKQFAAASAELDSTDDRYDPPPVPSLRDQCIITAVRWLPQLEDDEHKINSRKVRRHILSIVPLNPQDYDYADWRMRIDSKVLEDLPRKLRWLSLIVPRNLEPYYRIGRNWQLKYKIWRYIPNERSRLWRFVRRDCSNESEDILSRLECRMRNFIAFADPEHLFADSDIMEELGFGRIMS